SYSFPTRRSSDLNLCCFCYSALYCCEQCGWHGRTLLDLDARRREVLGVCLYNFRRVWSCHICLCSDSTSGFEAVCSDRRFVPGRFSWFFNSFKKSQYACDVWIGCCVTSLLYRNVDIFTFPFNCPFL